MTISIFDGVKGLGAKRKELLIKAYPDIVTLKEATLEELGQLLPEDVALELYKHLHS